MSTILKQAASPQVMNQAWRKLRNDKAVWKPGLERAAMEPNLVFHIMALAQELRSGAYQPQPTRFFPVAKGNGKTRIISSVCLRDKIAQRAVLSVLEPMGEQCFHHNSFGYRPGRTIDMALARAREYILCGMEWVVDADIKGYFDNIPHALLIKQVKRLVNDSRVTELIRRWIDIGIPRRGFLSQAKGIPQGAVISPFLCNLFLTPFDNDLDAGNLPFVRFADDFLVFAKTEQNARAAREYVANSLNKLKLGLHPRKTRITRCGPHVRFLGRKLPKIKKPLALNQ